MYDFHKCKAKLTNYQIFKHPFFVQGKRNILVNIKRKSNAAHPHKIQKDKTKSQIE